MLSGIEQEAGIVKLSENGPRHATHFFGKNSRSFDAASVCGNFRRLLFLESARVGAYDEKIARPISPTPPNRDHHEIQFCNLPDLLAGCAIMGARS
jgi:hypothetical protein